MSNRLQREKKGVSSSRQQLEQQQSAAKKVFN
jgi:hypothetical protein